MIVGSLHIKCSLVRCGHVYPVDADEFLSDLEKAVMDSVKNGHAGTYSYPNRYCPRCEASAKHYGHETDKERDERIEELKESENNE